MIPAGARALSVLALALAIARPAHAQHGGGTVLLGPHDTAAHVVRSHQSGYADATRLVVRDPVAWSATWATLQSGRPDAPPPPAIDFRREMVILAALGARTTGGYAIGIDSVRRSGDEIEAVVRTTVPAPGCATTFALTEAVDVVRVARSERAVTFTERRSIGPKCWGTGAGERVLGNGCWVLGVPPR